MAYMDQEKKAKIAAELNKVMPKNWKYSLRVNNYSTIIMTIYAAPVDLYSLHAQKDQWRDGYIQLNEYYLENQYEGEVLKVLQAARVALNTDNYDRSDSMTDYFNVGHYVNMHIGAFNRPFQYTPPAAKPATSEMTYEELKAKVAKLEAELV